MCHFMWPWEFAWPESALFLKFLESSRLNVLALLNLWWVLWIKISRQYIPLPFMYSSHQTPVFWSKVILLSVSQPCWKMPFFDLEFAFILFVSDSDIWEHVPEHVQYECNVLGFIFLTSLTKYCCMSDDASDMHKLLLVMTEVLDWTGGCSVTCSTFSGADT